jgi:hypothetical protein
MCIRRQAELLEHCVLLHISISIKKIKASLSRHSSVSMKTDAGKSTESLVSSVVETRVMTSVWGPETSDSSDMTSEFLFNKRVPPRPGRGFLTQAMADEEERQADGKAKKAHKAMLERFQRDQEREANVKRNKTVIQQPEEDDLVPVRMREKRATAAFVYTLASGPRQFWNCCACGAGTENSLCVFRCWYCRAERCSQCDVVEKGSC